jgi:two-component system LytT family response regulator
MFSTIPFKVIFITAYSEYAIRAFRFSATDYLMKPVSISELTEAVSKVRRELDTLESFQNISALLENLQSPQTGINKLVIPDNKGFSVIRLSEIIFCQADSYCTIFHLTGNSGLLSSKNLKYYEDLLPPEEFMRVHNSFLVNIRHVTGYTYQGDITMSENRSCPLSIAYKPLFLKLFRKFR